MGETIEKHGYHPQPQIVRGLAVAPDGRLWVQVNTVEGTRILLLDPEGHMEGMLPEKFPMPLTFLLDGRPLIQGKGRCNLWRRRADRSPRAQSVKRRRC